jgi:hypothetical protein
VDVGHRILAYIITPIGRQRFDLSRSLVGGSRAGESAREIFDAKENEIFFPLRGAIVEPLCSQFRIPKKEIKTMISFFRASHSRQRVTRLARFTFVVSVGRLARLAAFVIVSVTAMVVTASAQSPNALFDQATITGSGNTITATLVPVVVSPGLTLYLNMTLQFNVDANGNLTLAPGFPQVVQAPTLLGSSFRAGTYVGPSTLLNGKALITVSGPGVLDGGATAWSLVTASGADPNTNPQSATWYVGPIANNPYADRIKRAGITSTAYSYGIISCGNNGCDRGFGSGALIGVSQAGNTLTIVGFYTGSDAGASTPQGQITFTLKQ